MTVLPPSSDAPLRWDDLQVFLAVVRHGSIGGAARALGLNHSTVLRRVASLEATLAARLFDRLPGGYALTAAGDDIAEQLAGVTEQIDAAHRRLMGRDVAIRGTVRLTTTDTLLHGLLLPPIARFRQLHPGVQVQVVVNNTFLSLTRREADVAVRGQNRPPENLVGRRVGAIRTALYASKAYLTAMGEGATTAAPHDHAWVAPDESLGHLEQAKWLARNVPPERIALRFDSLTGMVAAVRHGAGVGLLLCPLADAQTDLVQLAPPDPALDTAVWVLSHPDLRQVARVRAFTQFVGDALAQDARLVH